MVKIKIKTKSFHLKTLNLAILNICMCFFTRFKMLQFRKLRKLIKKLKKIIILKAPKINKSARNQLGMYTYGTDIQLNLLLTKAAHYSIILYYMLNLVICRLSVAYVSLRLTKILIN